ncbi:hypothetical protein [Pseudobacillus badius]|uniref:hypothetical protein n=1 Tax=Bacillus badius TaxID=1455 RepID=UPI003D81B65B
MSKTTFTTREIKLLKNNPNVERVSERSIAYSDSFKDKFMNEYLDEQAELLKKLELTERRLLNASENLKPNKVYQLIYETIEQNQYSRMTKYFCDLLDVSRSEYYSYLKASSSREASESLDVEAKEMILKAFHHRGYKKGSRPIKMILENDYNQMFSRKRCIH